MGSSEACAVPVQGKTVLKTGVGSSLLQLRWTSNSNLCFAANYEFFLMCWDSAMRNAFPAHSLPLNVLEIDCVLCLF